MSSEKQIIVDLIQTLENGCVQVRTCIKENGEKINNSFHRHVVAPGDDFSVEDAKVQAICAEVHTFDVVAAYKAAQEATKAAQFPA